MGALVSCYLVGQHVLFVAGNEDAGLCGLVKAFDCAAVEASQFSELGGIPTASFGVLYFAVLSCFLWIPRRGVGKKPENSEDVSLASFLTLVGLITSVCLALISAFVIHAFCLGCTIVYYVNLLNSVVVASMLGFSPVGYFIYALRGIGVAWRVLLKWLPRGNDWRLTRGSLTAFLIVVFLAPLLGAGPPLWARHLKNRDVIQRYESRPAVEVKVANWSLVRGEPNAPLQIVVFTDFECPFCRESHHTIREALEPFSGQYHLVYKHYPLSSDCNPNVPKPRNPHPRACPMARLAQLSDEMDIFWEIGDALYEAAQSPDLKQALAATAERFGIDYEQWMHGIHRPDIHQRVQADIEEGARLGVEGVPTVFVNGRRLPSLDRESIELILKKQLQPGED